MRSFKSVVPSGVKLKSVMYKSHRTSAKEPKGVEVDIQNIVAKFSVTESIYSPTLTLEMSIVDSNNLFEYHDIIGQETITIEMLHGKIGTKDEQSLKLEFYITHYPTYGRKGQNTQVYTFIGISPHAYKSMLTKVCRPYSEPRSDIMSVMQLVGVTNIEVQGSIPTSPKGIINVQTPLSACEFLREQLSDENKAPVYFFETLDGVLHLTTHTSMMDVGGKIANNRTYYDLHIYGAKPDSGHDYEERRGRILEIASNLSMSKYDQSRNGAYASTTHSLDIANKTYTTSKFNYGSMTHLNEGELISKEWKPFDHVTIDKNEMALRRCIATNADAYEGQVNYGSSIKLGIATSEAREQQLDNYIHDIKLFGDFTFMSGSKIELKIQKSIDPGIRKEYKKGESDGDDDAWDLKQSGAYIVTSVVHDFRDNNYFIKARVKKDV